MKTRLLTKKERAYLIEKITNLKTYQEEFGKLRKKEEGEVSQFNSFKDSSSAGFSC